MTQPAGHCPNCGAPIAFQWANAVQTVCTHCRSVVVRHDVDLAAIGERSDLPADSSPIQLGTEGRVDGHTFRVIGRIAYEYDQGGWNEWHIVFSDGTSGWLSDAQAEYAVARQRRPEHALPARERAKVGLHYDVDGAALQIATLTEARYKGVDGELPFEYWGKAQILFADLRSADTAFATIDYSETPPLLFSGRFVEFDELELKNIRPLDQATLPGTAARGFNCRHCGGAVELRALQHTRTVACTTCGAILDPRDPSVMVLQEAARRTRIAPLIPLGTHGTVAGHSYEVVGFQQRFIVVDDVHYSWREYVLFNPYYGFRYISEYDGHWNLISTLHGIPTLNDRDARSAGRFRSFDYRHFQSATAVTEYVLGEFPWQVRTGDRVDTSDFVSPPRMLSSESTGDETTWSLGEYTPGARIWEMFALPGAPPEPAGVFANQPSPYAGSPGRYWRTFALLAILIIAVFIARVALSARESVFSQTYSFVPQAAEPAFVTPTFTLAHPGTVDLDVATNVDNSWLYLDLALINVTTGEAIDLGKEIGQYHGVDSDGSWSEGSRNASWRLPRLPEGEYYLRVEPENDGRTVRYAIHVTRDVPSFLPYGIALALLAIPPALVSLRASGFERRRWAESDHPAGGDD